MPVLVRTTPFQACVTVLLCFAVATATGQETRGAADVSADVLAGLGSGHEQDRLRAERTLESPAQVEFARSLLRHADHRMRRAAARALAVEPGASTAEWLLDAWNREAERDVKDALVTAMLGVAAKVRRPVAAVLWESESTRPLALSAARRFMRAELEHEARVGEDWSNYRSLGLCHWLGKLGTAATATVLDDESAADAVRALAAITLGRCEDDGAWSLADGSASPDLKRRLESTGETVKTALLYGLSASGTDSADVARVIATFIRTSAFSSEHIEAGLYVLRTLPEAAFSAARQDITLCVRDFLTSGHSERVVFNASNLLERLRDPELVDGALSVFEIEDLFAAYWVLDAVVLTLDGLPAAESRAKLEAALAWGLRQKVPQIRAYALHAWRARFGREPQPVDTEALLAEVRASARAVRTAEFDSDFFAQRSAVEVLALHGDKTSADLFRDLLGHHNESVRMITAMSAARAGLTELGDALAALAARKAEYATFGAAWALRTLGDQRCLPAFADLFHSGNAILMRPSHVNLVTHTGHNADVALPKRQQEWRDLGDSWRALVGDQLKRE